MGNLWTGSKDLIFRTDNQMELWKTLPAQDVLQYIEDGYPTAAQVDLFYDDVSRKSGKDQFIDGFTKSQTTMDYGLFGQDDYYFFYLEFQPPYDIETAGLGFEIWF